MKYNNYKFTYPDFITPLEVNRDRIVQVKGRTTSSYYSNKRVILH